MVAAGGADIGQRQMHGRRPVRLQRAVQVHRVVRVGPFVDVVGAGDRPGRGVAIGDGGGDRSAAGHIGAGRAAGARQADRVLFGALHQAVGDRTQIDHQVGHRAAGAGVGQRAGAGIEAQVGAPADCCVHRRHEVRMVAAGGADIGQRQMHGRRLVRLQRAGQVHRVVRVGPFVDVVGAGDRPGRGVAIGDGGGDFTRAQGDVGNRGCTRVAQHNLKLFGALHQAVGDRTQIDHQVGHRAAGAGVGQRAGAGIEAQVGAPADCRVHRRRKVRIIGAGGGEIIDRQINRRRLARLQRAGPGAPCSSPGCRPR